jgi:hypothetical protein
MSAGSLTLKGSLTKPEFIFRFLEIRPNNRAPDDVATTVSR